MENLIETKFVGALFARKQDSSLKYISAWLFVYYCLAMQFYRNIIWRPITKPVDKFMIQKKGHPKEKGERKRKLSLLLQI